MANKKAFMKIGNSIFANFIISYGIVFFIPVMIIFAAYYQVTTSLVKAEIEKAKLMPVNQFKRLMEDEIHRAKNISGFINSSPELAILLGLKQEEITPADRLHIVRFRRFLTTFTGSNSSIGDIYLYLKDRDYCISISGSRSNIDTFLYFHKEKEEVISFPEWTERMQEYHTGSILSADRNSVGKVQKKKNLYYVQSLPVVPLYSTDATLVLQFSAAAIENAMNIELLQEDTYLSIIDSDGAVLLESSPQAPIDLDPGMLSEEIGSFNYHGHTISYMKSSVVPATFVSIIPVKNFREDLENIQNLFLIVLGTCIIVGAVLTYFFTIRNYNPVKQLLQITRQYSTAGGMNNGDVFTEIRLALLDAIDHKIQLESWKKTDVETRQKEKILYMILDLNYTEEKVKQFLKQMQVQLVKGDFYMIQVQISDYSTHLYDFGSLEDDIAKPLSICAKVYYEMLSLVFYTQAFIYKNAVILLVSIQEQNPLMKIRNTILDAQKFMRDNYAMDTYAAISDIHQVIGDISNGYRETLQAIQYLELIGKETIVEYEDFSKLNPMDRIGRFMIKEEQLFFGSLRAGNFEEAKRIINHIVEKYFFHDMHSPQLVRCRLFGLMNNIVDNLVVLDIPKMNQFVEELDPYNRILNCRNAHELQQELNMLIDEISQFSTREDYDEEYKFKRRVIEIVQKNYADPNLNVSFIADLMGKNLDYVSRTFKKTTMIGLLDYIHHTRIKAAKALLMDTRILTVQQISSMVGYTSCDSFIRAFKRVEGFTPGRYREIHDKNKKDK